MTDYSAYMVFYLMIPVLTQILFPLLMLLVFGFVRMVSGLFNGQIADDLKNVERGGENMQLNMT